jgi:hypothetical protein
VHVQDKSIVARKTEQPETAEARQKRVRQKALKALRATQNIPGSSEAETGFDGASESCRGHGSTVLHALHDSDSEGEDNLLLAQPKREGKASLGTASQAAPSINQEPTRKPETGTPHRQSAGPHARHKGPVAASNPVELVKRPRTTMDARVGSHKAGKKQKAPAKDGQQHDKMAQHYESSLKSKAKMCVASFNDLLRVALCGQECDLRHNLARSRHLLATLLGVHNPIIILSISNSNNCRMSNCHSQKLCTAASISWLYGAWSAHRL